MYYAQNSEQMTDIFAISAMLNNTLTPFQKYGFVF